MSVNERGHIRQSGGAVHAVDQRRLHPEYRVFLAVHLQRGEHQGAAVRRGSVSGPFESYQTEDARRGGPDAGRTQDCQGNGPLRVQEKGHGR